MADENFKKTMAMANGELDRKHQLFEDLVRPLPGIGGAPDSKGDCAYRS